MSKPKKTIKKEIVVDDKEMQEILANKDLLKRMERGSKQGKKLKGKYY